MGVFLQVVTSPGVRSIMTVAPFVSVNLFAFYVHFDVDFFFVCFLSGVVCLIRHCPNPPPLSLQHPTHTLATMTSLWSKISAILPPTEDQFPLEFGDNVDSCVVETLTRSRRQLYADTPPACQLLNAKIILDFSWEKLNTGTWRHVDKEWRRVYSYGCLFKAAALCQGAPTTDELLQAVRTCDMGLLMGAAVMGDVLQVVIGILQREVRDSTKDADADEHPQAKVGCLFSEYCMSIKSAFYLCLSLAQICPEVCLVKLTVT